MNNEDHTLSQYEHLIIKDIAKNIVEPNLLTRVLNYTGAPISKTLDWAKSKDYLKKIPELVEKYVSQGIKLSISAANKTCSDEGILVEAKKIDHTIQSYEQIKELDLESKDKIADRFNLSNAFILSTEGVMMGMATSASYITGPFAPFLISSAIATDIGFSISGLSRSVCQIASSYGYSSKELVNLPHILSAMVPTSSSSDEAYFALKASTHRAIMDAGSTIAKLTVQELEELIAKGDAPFIIKIIEKICSRLSITLTEKELALLFPAVGAVINGSVNLAFQQVGHRTAKDYFRIRHLGERYGDEIIETLIQNEMTILKRAI